MNLYSFITGNMLIEAYTPETLEKESDNKNLMGILKNGVIPWWYGSKKGMEFATRARILLSKNTPVRMAFIKSIKPMLADLDVLEKQYRTAERMGDDVGKREIANSINAMSNQIKDRFEEMKPQVVEFLGRLAKVMRHVDESPKPVPSDRLRAALTGAASVLNLRDVGDYIINVGVRKK